MRKVQKQDWDWRIERRLCIPHQRKFTADVEYNLLAFFQLWLVSALFHVYPHLKWIFAELLSPSLSYFWGVSIPTSPSLGYSPPNTVSHCRQMHWSLMPRLYLNISHAHTHKAIAFSNFQTKVMLRWLLHTKTHLQKQVVYTCTHMHSCPSTCMCVHDTATSDI